MSHRVIDRSPDIKRLRDEKYEVEVKGALLLVHNVPYVNSSKEVRYGTLVSTLNLADDVASYAGDHVVMFTGSQPCNADGTIITQIQHSDQRQDLGQGIIVERSFSNKPASGYRDYFEKMSRYVRILSDAARAIDRTVTAQTGNLIPGSQEESVFLYFDSATSRANIGALTEKFHGQRLAIVGLGGTGAFLLDGVAKTPVAEINLFDDDIFFQHNAFRSPGAASSTDLQAKPKKVNYYAELYGRMRRGVIPHECYVTRANLAVLRGMDFVFLCIDKSEVKKDMIPFLEAEGIPFIDCGLGVKETAGRLGGVIRVTASTPDEREIARARIPSMDDEDDAYDTNIQIAELNALNATMAIIKWKKIIGFYHDSKRDYHVTYTLAFNTLDSEGRI